MVSRAVLGLSAFFFFTMITLFQEIKLLTPETDYYKNLGIEIQKYNISVDQFFFGNFNNIATFGMTPPLVYFSSTHSQRRSLVEVHRRTAVPLSSISSGI